MKIRIRMEKENDFDIVVSITEFAFKQMPHADGDENELVRNLRKSDNFIPGLSLVTELKG